MLSEVQLRYEDGTTNQEVEGNDPQAPLTDLQYRRPYGM